MYFLLWRFFLYSFTLWYVRTPLFYYTDLQNATCRQIPMLWQVYRPRTLKHIPRFVTTEFSLLAFVSLLLSLWTHERLATLSSPLFLFLFLDSIPFWTLSLSFLSRVSHFWSSERNLLLNISVQLTSSLSNLSV